LVLPLSVLALWWTAADRLWLPPQLLPAPALVWESLRDMLVSGELASQLAVSLERVGWSLLLGAPIGWLLGTAFALSRSARAYLYPSFRVFAQFPVIGWAPLLIVFLGIDEGLKISAITLAVLVPFAVTTRQALLAVPADLPEVGRVYRFSRWQLLSRVVVPCALPGLASGLRQGFMQAWLALVFVELLVSGEGIGYLMVSARNLMQLDVVVVTMLAIGAVGLGFDVLLSALERRLWRGAPKGLA
jgi:sulfonate transport system permease protein